MNLPIVLYCAIPFYKSSWGALKVKSISMDVPVSAAIILGTLASTWNLITGSPHIYWACCEIAQMSNKKTPSKSPNSSQEFMSKRVQIR